MRKFRASLEPFWDLKISKYVEYLTRVSSEQARTQPFSKGGSIGGVSQITLAFMLWALTHTPPRGVWGHARPEIFGNLDSEVEGDSETF